MRNIGDSDRDCDRDSDSDRDRTSGWKHIYCELRTTHTEKAIWNSEQHRSNVRPQHLSDFVNCSQDCGLFWKDSIRKELSARFG